MIRWTSLASWKFEFPVPGSLASSNSHALCLMVAIVAPTAPGQTDAVFAVVCTDPKWSARPCGPIQTRRRIPASASANRRLEKGDLTPLVGQVRGQLLVISPHSGSIFFIIFLICTASRLPASASANHRIEKGDLTPFGGQVRGQLVFTSPHSGIKSSFLISLIFTTSRRILASASTNQGPEKGDLNLL